jgi:hypothetical protein
MTIVAALARVTAADDAVVTVTVATITTVAAAAKLPGLTSISDKFFKGCLFALSLPTSYNNVSYPASSPSSFLSSLAGLVCPSSGSWNRAVTSASWSCLLSCCHLRNFPVS